MELNRFKQLLESKSGDVKPLLNEEEKSTTNNSLGKITTTYSGEARKNIELLVNKMVSKGITDPIVQIGLLATIGKESYFIPQNEKSYKDTPNSSIRKVFSSTKRLSDKELTELKNNPEYFFNYVYGPYGVGPDLGNVRLDDGYKYIGRGFNQITGRNNYRNYGYEGNPESLNNVSVAASAAVNFLAKEGKSLNNKFKSIPEALKFFVVRNHGGKYNSAAEQAALNQLQYFKMNK